LYPERYKEKSKILPLLGVVAFIAIGVGVVMGIHHLIKSREENVARRQAEQEASERQRRIAAEDEQKKLRAPIVIKGLFIGMTRQEMAQAVQSKLGSGWYIYKGQGSDSYESDIVCEAIHSLDNTIRVIFDGDAKAKLILFSASCSRVAFDCADMNGEQFAQTICNSYNVPALTATTLANGAKCWECVAPNNVRVRIGVSKEMSLEKISPTDLRTFN